MRSQGFQRPVTKPRWVGLLVILVLPTATHGQISAGTEAVAIPVVLAVDTSRSLSSRELRSASARLGQLSKDLPPATPLASMAFDDAPRWLTTFDDPPSQTREALSRLAPKGDHTLLHDALFSATRELPEGGVVLLVSDGRDENSATTVDDIARRSEAQGVRILTLGVGRQIEERALRRLALITNGVYLGRLDDVETSAIREALAVARNGVDDERRARQASGTPKSAKASQLPSPPHMPSPDDQTQAQLPSQTPPAALRSTPSLSPVVWIAGLGLLALAAILLLLRNRRSTTPIAASCSRCGTAVTAGEDRCESCTAWDLQRTLRERSPMPATKIREVTGDTVVFDQLSLDEKLDKTRVLTERAILIVRERGEEPRAFVLDSTQAVAVGRKSADNTLRILDPALSAHHFKIVPDGEKYYFIDLESTNGSTVNSRRCIATELRSGDVIRAGQAEFEFKSRTEPQ